MRKILEIKMKKEPCNSIFQILDIYNKDFPLRIFGKEKYTTKEGSVLGMISIIAIISFSLFFLLELFSRKTLMVVYNKNSNILPFVDLTNALFMVAVTDKTGKLLPLQGVYNLEIKMLHYYTDKEKMVTAFNSTNIDFEVCNIKKHNETYGEVFKETQYQAFYCVQPGHQNKTLYGKQGDFPNGFSLLGVYINRCDPKRQECLDESVIDKYLSDFVLGIIYSSYSVDHYNYSTPNTPKYENNGVFPMTYSILKCYYYNLAQVIYETDYGLVFEEKQKIEFYEFESQTVDINMPGTITNSIFAPESTVGYILFKCSENISYFNRSYGKAQAVIANIGGVIKAMLVVTKLVFDFFTRKCIMVDLANTFFEFSNCEDENNRKFQFRKSNSNFDENILRHNKDINKSLSVKNEIIVKNINKNHMEDNSKSNCNNPNEVSNFNNKNKKKDTLNKNDPNRPFNGNKIDKMNMRGAVSAASQNSLKKLKLNSIGKDIRTKEKSISSKPKSLGLNSFEWILPNIWIRKHNNIRTLNLCEKIINNKLSVETVFNTSHKIEFLANSILNDSQIKEYKENNKIYLDLNNKDIYNIKYFLNISKFEFNDNCGQNLNIHNVSNDHAILLNKRNLSVLQ